MLRAGLSLAVAALLLALLGPVAAQDSEYRLGPKDVLKITVWGHDDLTRTSVVSADGTIAFPLLGTVRAAGLTPGQFEAQLRQLLAKDYLVDPQVTVTVEEYRSQRVFVLGEAEKPGTYPLTGRTTLLDVLSQAGGPGRSAGRHAIIVRVPQSDGPVPPGTAGATTLRVNLRKLLDGDIAENLILQNGDTVYLPRATSFFVLGEVRRPGAYSMEQDTTVLEAITLAGGLTERAAAADTKILRKRGEGVQETIAVDLSGIDPRARDTLLSDGDTLLIPAGNTFYVLGEVKRPGAYQLDQATTALGGIALAGGFTDRAAPNRTKIIRTHRDGRQETLVVDLNEIIKRGRKDKDLPLVPNDVIVVPESFF